MNNDDNKKELFTVEVNLDADPMLVTSWHTDYVLKTIRDNIFTLIEKRKTDRWVLIGIVSSQEDALRLRNSVIKLFMDYNVKQVTLNKEEMSALGECIKEKMEKLLKDD